MRAWALLAATSSLALAACGGDDDRPAAKSTPERTATATPTKTATPKPAPTRARSVQDCVDIWNASVEAGEGFQVAHTDYVADNVKEGRADVRVQLRGARVAYNARGNEDGSIELR
jgi:hypothetical protein